MLQSHVPQCTILSQKCAHMCTFLLQNDALWDICLMHCGICEMGPFCLGTSMTIFSLLYLRTESKMSFLRDYHHWLHWKLSCFELSLYSLQWRHNKRDGISNRRRLDCLLNRLFMRKSKKTPKIRYTGLCEGNPPVTGGFPSQRTNNAEKSFRLMTSSCWRNLRCFTGSCHASDKTSPKWRHFHFSWWPVTVFSSYFYLYDKCHFTVRIDADCLTFRKICQTWHGIVRQSSMFNSSPPGQNGHHFRRRHFQTYFLEWTYYNFKSIFTEICS